MKRIQFLSFLFIAVVFSFYSCGSDSGDGDGNNGNNEITSITLSLKFDTDIYVGGLILFDVKGNNNQDVTSSTTITLNGNDIGGNVYTAQNAGVLNFVASYGSLTSNLQVTVLEPPIKFAQNVLIEDYTGTWCGYCPRVSYGIEQVKLATDRAVTVAIHRGNADPNGNNHDPYNFSAGDLEDMINLSGYPTAMLNRTTEWAYPEPSNVSQVVSLTASDADVGLAISPTLDGNTMNIDVDVKFGLLSTPNAKLVVYVLEDDLFYDQENYTSYYGGSSVLTNFEHDYVLRDVLTNLLGDTIPENEVTEGNVYSRNFSVPVPSNVSNTSKMTIVAFVVNGNTNAAYNVRSAFFGDSQTIEEL